MTLLRVRDRDVMSFNTPAEAVSYLDSQDPRPAYYSLVDGDGTVLEGVNDPDLPAPEPELISDLSELEQ